MVTGGLASALADRYRFLRELGAGGMATVWLAEDLKHQRRVAVKVVHAEVSETVGAWRFLQEIRLVAGLSHPHIVPLFDSGECGGVLFYVMAYLESESLRSRLAQGSVPVAEALRITHQVADALAYAHERGIVHRDIKPENILLTRSGHAIVVDFGIARALRHTAPPAGAQVTASGLALGTPAYMSPEQTAGDQGVDARTDQYSLALVCYEMLAGDLPGAGGSIPALLARRLVEQPPSVRIRRPEVGAAQNRALRRAMAPIPEDRFGTIAEFTRALLQAADAGTGLREAPAEPVIAVRPLTSHSTDADDRFLADGIAEEILTALSQVRGLRVAGRASSFAFRGDHVDLQRLAGELQATHVLSGSMRRVGARLRVSAELVAAPAGEVCWADRFDREVTDIFAIQDEIAAAVTQALRLVLVPPSTRPGRQVNLAAHELFLRARSLTAAGRFAAARGLIDQGLALDPASLTGKLSMALWLCGSAMYGVLSPTGAFPAAKSLVTEVLEAGPDATALFCLAWIAWMNDWDARSARRHFESSLRLRPDGRTRAMYALFLAATGQQDEALEESHRAVLADPFDFTARHERADVLRRIGRHEEAIAEARHVLELFPGSPFALWYLASSSLALGHLAEAETWAEQAVQHGFAPGEAALVQILAGTGRQEEAQARLDAVIERSGRQWVSPLALAVMHLALGDEAKAWERIEQAVAGRDLYLSVLRGEPAFAALEAELRFQDLLRTVGL
jgi:serine/threonine-protein kinase